MQNQLFAGTGELRCGVTHDGELVKRLVNEWHSVLTAPQGWKVAFLLSDGPQIIGVATWGRPVARLEDQETTLELTRMALHDAPHNAATWFLSRMRRWIRVQMPHVNRLISYQDCEKHAGTMYRADNWKQIYTGAAQLHTWTNRAGRIGNERTKRAKWEHSLRRITR